MIRVSLPSIAIDEHRFVYFPFEDELAVGETVDSVDSVEASVYSGTDLTPDDLIEGSATILTGDRTVQQLIDATQAAIGNVYNLKCTVLTSEGQTLQCGGFLAIVEDQP